MDPVPLSMRPTLRFDEVGPWTFIPNNSAFCRPVFAWSNRDWIANFELRQRTCSMTTVVVLGVFGLGFFVILKHGLEVWLLRL
jgi:hypothetical protein